MKKRLNWFKVILFILMIAEIIALATADRNIIKTNITAWRCYCVCAMFIPINFMIICTKRKVRK